MASAAAALLLVFSVIAPAIASRGRRGLASVTSIVFQNGGTMSTGTTAGDTLAVRAYDVDDATYRNLLLGTAGATVPTLVIGNSATTFSLASTAFTASTAGALSGVTSLAMGGALSGATTGNFSGAITGTGSAALSCTGSPALLSGEYRQGAYFSTTSNASDNAASTTSGILIGSPASAGPGLESAITILSGWTNDITNDAGNWKVTNAGAPTFAGALAANGGITFDAATDTLGAFTLAGLVDFASTYYPVNLGNAGTDFTATGGLNLQGVLALQSNTSTFGGFSLSSTNDTIGGASGYTARTLGGSFKSNDGSWTALDAGTVVTGILGTIIVTDQTIGASSAAAGVVAVGKYSSTAVQTLGEIYGVIARAGTGHANSTGTTVAAITSEDCLTVGTTVNCYGYLGQRLTGGDTLNRAVDLDLSVGTGTEAVTDFKMSARTAATLLGNHIMMDLDGSTNVTLSSKTMTVLQLTAPGGERALNVVAGEVNIANTPIDATPSLQTVCTNSANLSNYACARSDVDSAADALGAGEYEAANAAQIEGNASDSATAFRVTYDAESPSTAGTGIVTAFRVGATGYTRAIYTTNASALIELPALKIPAGGGYSAAPVEDAPFGMGYIGSSFTIAGVTATWGTAGSGGATGVVVQVICGAANATCVIGACNAAANTPVRCTLSVNVAADGLCTVEIDTTTDCAGNPALVGLQMDAIATP